MQNIILLDTEKLGLPAGGATLPPPPHTHWRNTGALGPPGPNAYELFKTPHRLVRSQYCGIVWVKEEGSWRDLEICVSPRVGGGRDLLPLPLLGKWGGEHPPPISTPMSSSALSFLSQLVKQLCKLKHHWHLIPGSHCREKPFTN